MEKLFPKKLEAGRLSLTSSVRRFLMSHDLSVPSDHVVKALEKLEKLVKLDPLISTLSVKRKSSKSTSESMRKIII